MASCNPILSSPSQESPFLSFVGSFQNGVISELIISFIAKGNGGGYQTLLNLRKVCSTTKKWVDELSPAQITRLFPELQVSIFLCRKNIAEFLRSPPPCNVTSLYPHNTEYLSSLLNKKQTAEEKKLVKSFINYWLPKLQSLETETLSTLILESFGSSTTLKTIRCNYMHDLFPKVLELENLCIKKVDFYKGGDPFLAQMAGTKNLKLLEIFGPSKIYEGYEALLNEKKHDRDFTLKLNLRFQDREKTNDLDLDLFRRFVTSVASSSSSINLMRVNDFVISKVLMITKDKKIIEKLFKRIKWIEFQYFTEVEFIVDLLSKNAFHNLERFDEDFLEAPRPQIQDIGDHFKFPESLQELTFRSKCFFKLPLPRCLKYLHINGVWWLFPELQNAIHAISDGCPTLEKFKISWACDGPPAIDWMNSQLQNNTIFPNLKILSCTIRFNFEDTLTSSRALLIDIFKLDTLKVERFKLRTYPKWDGDYPMILGEEILNLLLRSPLAESLVSLEFEYVIFEEGASAAVEKLNSLVEDNLEKYQERYGRKSKQCYLHNLYKRY